MFKLFFIFLFLVAIFAGCSTFQKQHEPIAFKDALKKFDEEFPSQWPTKSVVEPLSGEQKKAIDDILVSLSQYFTNNNIDHKVSGYEIIILPTQTSQLNQTSFQLSTDQISLKYNALYFAKNPFSAGTFDHESKQFLLSQNLFDNQIKLQRVIRHEMIHVNTYKNKLQKTHSAFYCIFTGPQFSPHYLSCDEMNAYLEDLKNLVAENVESSEIAIKLKSAEIHTLPVIELISNLNYKTTTFKEGIVFVKGKNKNGEYQMEFPDFILKQKSDLIVSTKEYGQFVKNTAKEIQNEFDALKKKLK